MNGYTDNLLKQFCIKHGRLYYLRGPLTGKPAGHKRPSGQIFIKFNGYTYNHDDLLFLYKQQLEEKHNEKIDTAETYKTISGQLVKFYNENNTALPYVIHGAVLINSRWHACQWTNTGESIQPEYNLEKTK